MNNLRDNVLLKDFGNKLRKLRTAKGYTMEKLSFESEMEISQIYRIEKGKSNPTYTTLISIAKGLGISLAELVK
jgi:transcriptional regulator with XRE-family HTH domain